MFPVGAGLAAAVGGVLAARADPRVLLIVALAALLPLLSANRLLGLAVGSILTLGLLRRLVSPGRIDYDPLLLLPLALLALAVVAHQRRAGKGASDSQNALLILLTAWPLVSQVVVGVHGLGAIYGAAIQSTAFLIIYLASNGYLPHLWHSVVRWCVPISLALSTYCILQYYVLFVWDERWMVSSRLASIGKPEPRLVRVFGTLESPGPCAVVLAILLLILIVRLAGKAPLAGRAVCLVAASLTAYALILTGVRAALVGAALALVFLAIRSGNLRLAALTLIAGASATIGISRLVASSTTSGSSILNQDRYDLSTIGTDDSLLSRLKLLDTIVPAIRRPLGAGVSSANSRFEAADNALVDVLVNFGPIMAVGFVALILILVSRVAKRRWEINNPDEASLVAVVVFLLFMMLVGNVFATTSGLFAALAIGWFLHPAKPTLPPAADGAAETRGHTPSGRTLL